MLGVPSNGSFKRYSSVPLMNLDACCKSRSLCETQMPSITVGAYLKSADNIRRYVKF